LELNPSRFEKNLKGWGRNLCGLQDLEGFGIGIKSFEVWKKGLCILNRILRGLEKTSKDIGKSFEV
jgi:hypothetical protein